MRRILAFTLGLILVVTVGCANMTSKEQRALSGGAIGAAGGALLGAIVGGSPAIGAGVGGAVGAAAGASGKTSPGLRAVARNRSLGRDGTD